MSTKGYSGANVLLLVDNKTTKDIVDLNSTDDEITVSGDVTDDLSSSPSDGTETDTITVSGTSDDDGDFTVTDVSYDSGADETTISTSESITGDTGEGTIEYSVFDEAAVQQSLTTENSRNMIEADYKQKGHANFIYGKKDGSLTLEALILNPSATQEAKQALEDAQDNNKEIVVRRKKTDPNSDTEEIEECPCLVENISKNYGDDEASTYTGELQKNDFWTTV